MVHHAEFEKKTLNQSLRRFGKLVHHGSLLTGPENIHNFPNKCKGIHHAFSRFKRNVIKR